MKRAGSGWSYLVLWCAAAGALIGGVLGYAAGKSDPLLPAEVIAPEFAIFGAIIGAIAGYVLWATWAVLRALARRVSDRSRA